MAQDSGKSNSLIKVLLRLGLLILVVVPVIAWLVVKPIRVIAPSLVGISCNETNICVETPSRIREADTLYTEALAFVGRNVGKIAGKPKFVFCTTEACANAFGLGARSAVTIGTFGTVIAPRAWKPYYVRHELIHYLQGERFGVLRRLFMPSWLIEGMAYSLSMDPRSPLTQPWEEYRAKFNIWLARVNRERMWEEAAKF